MCRVPNRKGKRFCLNKEIFIISLKGKLIRPSKENAQLRQSYLKRSLNWTDENGRCRMLTALHDTGIQLQSQRMELDQANQLTDQTQREKSWLCEELEMRNESFSGRSCKTLSRN